MSFRLRESGKSGNYTKWCIELCSGGHHGSRVDKNTLILEGFGRYAYLDIPVIIKPKLKYVDYIAPSGERIKYTDIIARRYGFSFDGESALHISYGIQPGTWISNDSKNSDHTKLWFYPWKNVYRIKSELILPNPDGTDDVIEELPFRSGINDAEREEQQDIVENHTKHVFTFNDYDGEEIEARVHKSVGVFRVNGGKRSGFWGFLTYLIKDKTYEYIEIEFNKEVGSRKASWKGGALGIHAPLNKYESLHDAFERLLMEENKRGKVSNIKYQGIK